MRILRSLINFSSNEWNYWKMIPYNTNNTTNLLNLNSSTISSLNHNPKRSNKTSENLNNFTSWEHETMQCSLCSRGFNFWQRRRHHCRLCHEAICEKCSLYFNLNLNVFTDITFTFTLTPTTKRLRVCKQCYQNYETKLKSKSKSKSKSKEKIDHTAEIPLLINKDFIEEHVEYKEHYETVNIIKSQQQQQPEQQQQKYQNEQLQQHQQPEQQQKYQNEQQRQQSPEQQEQEEQQQQLEQHCHYTTSKSNSSSSLSSMTSFSTSPSSCSSYSSNSISLHSKDKIFSSDSIDQSNINKITSNGCIHSSISLINLNEKDRNNNSISNNKPIYHHEFHQISTNTTITDYYMKTNDEEILFHAAQLIQNYLSYSYDLKHDHRHFVRSEIINWFIDTKFTQIREEGSAIFYALVQKNYLLQIPTQNKRNSSLYHLNTEIMKKEIEKRQYQHEHEHEDEHHIYTNLSSSSSTSSSSSSSTTTITSTLTSSPSSSSLHVTKSKSPINILQHSISNEISSLSLYPSNSSIFHRSSSMPLAGRQKLPPKMLCKTKRCWNCRILFLTEFGSDNGHFCSIDCKTNSFLREQDTSLAKQFCDSNSNI